MNSQKIACVVCGGEVTVTIDEKVGRCSNFEIVCLLNR